MLTQDDEKDLFSVNDELISSGGIFIRVIVAQLQCDVVVRGCNHLFLVLRCDVLNPDKILENIVSGCHFNVIDCAMLRDFMYCFISHDHIEVQFSVDYMASGRASFNLFDEDTYSGNIGFAPASVCRNVLIDEWNIRDGDHWDHENRLICADVESNNVDYTYLYHNHCPSTIITLFIYHEHPDDVSVSSRMRGGGRLSRHDRALIVVPWSETSCYTLIRFIPYYIDFCISVVAGVVIRLSVCQYYHECSSAVRVLHEDDADDFDECSIGIFGIPRFFPSGSYFDIESYLCLMGSDGIMGGIARLFHLMSSNCLRLMINHHIDDFDPLITSYHNGNFLRRRIQTWSGGIYSIYLVDSRHRQNIVESKDDASSDIPFYVFVDGVCHDCFYSVYYSNSHAISNKLRHFVIVYSDLEFLSFPLVIDDRDPFFFAGFCNFAFIEGKVIEINSPGIRNIGIRLSRGHVTDVLSSGCAVNLI